MKKVRTALSGLGRIGWGYHLPSIAGHDGFELTAVTDPIQERVDEVYEKYGVKGYTDFNALISNEEIDLLVIASPTVYHCNQAIAAFEHGIDVFLDKPMAPTFEETNLIMDSMKLNRRKLMVYQPERAKAEFQALKSILDKGLIGSVYMIKRACSRYERRNDWQALNKFGGGMLNNYGAHYIDQTMKLSNSRAARVFCEMRRIAGTGDADDVVKVIIETENGMILDLDINMASPFEFPKWYILGSHGAVTFNDDESNNEFFHVKYLKENELAELPVKPELAAAGRLYDNSDRLQWHEHRVEISSFKKINYYDKCYDYFALDAEAFVPVEESHEVMNIINKCRKDAGW